MTAYTSIGVETHGHVGLVEIRKPPLNFFDVVLIREIGSAFDAFDADPNIRATVLAAQGKVFCAGADFGDGRALNNSGQLEGNLPQGIVGNLYQEAVRLYRLKKPMVGAIQGAAVGGGLGLAVVPDFRVAAPEARFCANFTRLGFHPGFGLTTTLPRVVGHQNAALMFYTSRRFTGEEAQRMGLVDVLVPLADVRKEALKLAAEIAENSPLGTLSTRATMRQGLADAVAKTTDHELAEQDKLRETADFKEGVKAVAERRVPNFVGR
ncbi:putative enoyl-CoA hydratase echA8 [Variibacter gotjawalensis]|uniref:Putative enoyl-CoA hydratase echA8 n=1 Tax=Variibacter gotjawalensis TaxID=1333996 RepID=A0A0S3PQR8_9BRAD|nr:enoyl-CoA hydratase/isomerase family protein [Variibacter gotjawalensis]NIK48597.1 enoyl-CoA hydratase/carnithine racemase [Variibacter gotjawalensis]RZS50462.1 enoyl-CoA hydratase/carnithine racemase [Variibacter gotjawalensis]BAT58296.1 putative enoyl-CoA hydratase echA8 [Variibacter gotjawalensis]